MIPDIAPVVLSHLQVAPLLAARAAGQQTAAVSPDLNRTTVTVRLEEDAACFPGGERLRWADARIIAAGPNKCYTLEGDTIQDIRVFSETTGWVRSLYPTEGAPTTLVSGLTMHRIEGCDPWQDTRNKIRAAAPVTGRVLDTATGLGYTAIQAAETAEHVLTVEIDPASLDIARLNPWSRGLFDNPRIEQVIADVWDVVEELPDESFSVIIHDPPAFSLGGQLYAGDFYAELFRLLKRRGRLFHYIGDPASKSVQRVQRGVVRRLVAAGFAQVVAKPRAFGVLALKTAPGRSGTRDRARQASEGT